MINELTGLSKRDAEQFERHTILAALFRLCDPLRTMDNLKRGDTVRLKSGGPVMTLGGQTGTGRYDCSWFDGKELKHAPFYLEQLERAEPEETQGPMIT